ncbi:PH domain-containing protein [Symmachiella dynata]|uniref:PH domain-containing protein n=1 Tax=Symmachiella dynata TaxID=2527995 RepID=UPI0030EEF7A7
MTTVAASRRPPISGVNTDAETPVMTVYPSIACTGLGRLHGKLYESMPVKLFGVKLSHWLFPLPSAPGAIMLYFYLKLFGVRYTVTNRSVQVWKSLGNRMLKQVSLNEIDDIAIAQDPGQVFYRAADLQLLNAAGEVILRLEGIPFPETFRNLILETRDARRQTDASHAVIAARHS